MGFRWDAGWGAAGKPQAAAGKVGRRDFDGDWLSRGEVGGDFAIGAAHDAGELMAVGQAHPPRMVAQWTHQDGVWAEGGCGHHRAWLTWGDRGFQARPPRRGTGLTYAMVSTFSMTRAAVGNCSRSSGGL